MRTRWQDATERRTRIALVASSLAQAGAEKQFVYTARALHQAGTDARVFYLGKGGHYEAVLRNADIPFYGIGCPGRPLVILLRLIRAFQGFRPDIVVASQFGDVIHAGLAGRLVGAFIAAGVRNNGDMRPHGRRMSLMLRLADVLVTNSECARENLLRLGVDGGKIRNVTNVIDLAEFDRRGSRRVSIPLPGGRTIAVAVGRMDKNKRFDRLVRALGLTRMLAPELAGLIVGRDFGEQSSLAAYANLLGLLPNHLAFTGESVNVPAILERTHMLLMTSDGEGFPNVLLEAMAAGLPVISTPAGDAWAIINKAKAGYGVDFDDTKGMAERMIRLAKSPGLREDLGLNGRREVEREYNFDSLADRLLTIYRQSGAVCNVCDQAQLS